MNIFYSILPSNNSTFFFIFLIFQFNISILSCLEIEFHNSFQLSWSNGIFSFFFARFQPSTSNLLERKLRILFNFFYKVITISWFRSRVPHVNSSWLRFFCFHFVLIFFSVLPFNNGLVFLAYFLWVIQFLWLMLRFLWVNSSYFYFCLFFQCLFFFFALKHLTLNELGFSLWFI